MDTEAPEQASNELPATGTGKGWARDPGARPILLTPLPLAPCQGARNSGADGERWSAATPGSAARHRSGWWRALWREDAGDGCPPTPLASAQGRARLEVMRPGLTRCAIACQRRRRGHLARLRVILRRGGPSVELSPRTFAQLQDHQRVGIRWLVGAVARGGGILGDDLGLGKTLQVLVAVDALFVAAKTPKLLIVGPAAPLGDWEAELARWRKAGVVDFRAEKPAAGALQRPAPHRRRRRP
jgi:hypothetical protein